MNLIVNADDFGFSEASNEAILSLAKSAKLSSTTVMVNMPYYKEITKALAIPYFGVGLHLNLTQGKPISQAASVSTLVNYSGEFYPYSSLIKKLLKGQVNTKHIQIEIEAQYSTLVNIIGDRITHIDSHQWIHKNPVLAKALNNWKRDFRPNDTIALRSPRRHFISPGGEIFPSRPSASFKKKLVNAYTNWLHNRYAKFFVLPEGELLALDNKKITTLKILMEDSISFKDHFIEVSCHPATSLEGIPKTKLLDKRIEEYKVLKSGNWNSKIKLTNFKNEL